ncbi:MAG: hypothetical protein ABIM62_06760 [candidate division WOR-3 bacterium]
MRIGEKERFSGKEKEEIMEVVEINYKRSGFKPEETLEVLGINYFRYLRWKKRKGEGKLEDQYKMPPNLRKPTEEEKEKVKVYA